jgi:hypothetical protein
MNLDKVKSINLERRLYFFGCSDNIWCLRFEMTLQSSPVLFRGIVKKDYIYFYWQITLMWWSHQLLFQYGETETEHLKKQILPSSLRSRRNKCRCQYSSIPYYSRRFRFRTNCCIAVYETIFLRPQHVVLSNNPLSWLVGAMPWRGVKLCKETKGKSTARHGSARGASQRPTSLTHRRRVEELWEKRTRYSSRYHQSFASRYGSTVCMVAGVF